MTLLGHKYSLLTLTDDLFFSQAVITQIDEYFVEGESKMRKRAVPMQASADPP